MNLKTLLLTGSLSALIPATTLLAQSSHTGIFRGKASVSTDAYKDAYLKQLKQLAMAGKASRSTAKTTATESRVIGYASRTYTGSSFLLTDTAALGYSGARGGSPSDDYPKADYVASMAYVDSLSALINSDSVTQIFDASDRLDTRTTKAWNNTSGVYENSNQQKYTYSGTLDKPDVILTTEWDGSGYVNYQKETYNYDAAGNQTGMLQQSWDGSTASWMDVLRTTTAFSATNKPLEGTYEIYLGSAWATVAAQQYIYDASDNLATDTVSSLDFSTMALVYNTIDLYTYDAAGNQLSQEYRNWNDVAGTWENNQYQDFMYDAAKNKTNTTTRYWNDGSSTYDTVYHEVATYNSYNQMETMKQETWDPVTRAWAPETYDYSDRYYYETFSTSAIPETPVKDGLVALYPVPAANELTVELKWNNPQALSVTLTDINGKQYLQRSRTAGADFKETINLQSIPSGNYFLQLHGDRGARIVQQVVVVH